MPYKHISIEDTYVLNTMLLFPVSYISTLRTVAERCSLPYVSTVHELSNDACHLYGVEVDLPVMFCSGVFCRCFYWAPQRLHPQLADEAAALQALISLQSRFGFAIVDYSFHNLVTLGLSCNNSSLSQTEASNWPECLLQPLRMLHRTLLRLLRLLDS